MANEVFEVGQQARGVGLGELLVDARVGEHVPAKSSTTAEIAGMPPSRSKSEPVLGAWSRGSGGGGRAPQRRSGFEVRGQRPPVERFVLDIAPQSGQRGEQLFLFLFLTPNLFKVLTGLRPAR